MKGFDRFCSNVVCPLFLVVCVAQLFQCGIQWEFGRYGMPRSLLAPNGQFADGSPIDPITAALTHLGIEEEFMLFMSVFFLLTMIQTVRVIRQTEKLKKNREALAQFMRRDVP